MTYIDTFSSLDDLRPNQRKSRRCVLRALHKAGRFSVFEATEYEDLANTLTVLCHDGSLEVNYETRYPWTQVELTERGIREAGLKMDTTP